MRDIVIQTSTYNKYGNGKRLIVSYVDKKTGYGSGTRIVGAKFNDFGSNLEIDVPLTIQQAKELIKELEILIRTKEIDDNIQSLQGEKGKD